MKTWKDGTPKSTNNAFTLKTNAVDWASLSPHLGSKNGGAASSSKLGSRIYLKNSSPQKAKL